LKVGEFLLLFLDNTTPTGLFVSS